MSTPLFNVRPSRRIHHKSYGIVGLFVLAMGCMGWWVIFRLFVCWGIEDDSPLTYFGCHVAHWVVLTMLMVAVVMLVFLVLELVSLHELGGEGRKSRFASARWAYRTALTRHERISSGVGAVLVVLGILVFLGLLLSTVRF